MPNTHLPRDWDSKLVVMVGGRFDPEKGRFLAAWSRTEGGSATWNPLNSTFDLPGSTLYNKVPGVKNYPGPIWGICATVLTLTERDSAGALVYPKLLGHLQSSAGSYKAEDILSQCSEDVAHWGTDTDLFRRVLAS